MPRVHDWDGRSPFLGLSAWLAVKLQSSSVLLYLGCPIQHSIPWSCVSLYSVCVCVMSER